MNSKRKSFILFDNCGQWIKEKFQGINRVSGAVYE